VVPADFQPFFTASVAASAALIGLLFVSVSIAPERVFGPNSEAVRQAQALSAFTALANVFFISMSSLIPHAPFGIMVTVVALPAVGQTLGLLRLWPHWRASRIVWRGLFLLIASAVVYGYEIGIGIAMWRSPGNLDALVSLLFLLLFAYAIGLGRAWELLGAPRFGLLSSMVGALGARTGRSRHQEPKSEAKP
jgi:hypothetical protein